MVFQAHMCHHAAVDVRNSVMRYGSSSSSSSSSRRRIRRHGHGGGDLCGSSHGREPLVLLTCC